MQFADIDDYRASHPQAVSYTPLIPGYRYTPPPPAFIFGNVSAALNGMIFRLGINSPVGFYRLREAKVCRENTIIMDDTVLTSTTTNHPEYYCRHIMAHVSPEAVATPRRIDGTVVSLVGPGWDNWGHWLVDFLPRIHVLTRYASLNQPLRYLLPSNARGFSLEWLRIVGIEAGSLIFFDPAEVVQVEELLVPENLSAGGIMHPVFREVTDWLCGRAFAQPEFRRSPVQRIYISRSSHPAVRRLVNREAVEDLATQFGYNIVDPTKLSVLQQVALFRGATHVAGEYGSGLHSTVFSPPTTFTTCFRGDGEAAGFLQSDIACLRQQSFGYVFGQREPGDPLEPFSIDLRQAEAGFNCAEEIALARYEAQ